MSYRGSDAVLVVSPEERAEAIHFAVSGLEEAFPDASSRRPIVTWQWRAVAALAAVFAVLVVLYPITTLSVLGSSAVLFYLVILATRLVIATVGLRRLERPDARSFPPVPDDDLPRYSVLMPAYHEPEVLARLLDGVVKVDYPADQLEILLLLEEDDEETIAALHAVEVPDMITVVMVPAEGPRTKPKACNYGLYFATGDIITIYDAEDLPDADQLRMAASAFEMGGEHLACVQARLDYFNERQNLLTKWFTLDYLTWFACFLPGLDRLALPIPLGGTSNHMRAPLLRELAGWDPYNVTEDADLGMRIYRLGYTTSVIPSVTLEEANSDAINWIRQRSRWYKGYAITTAVLFRNPRQAVAELGWVGAAIALLLIGATPVLAALNLFTWLITAAFFIGVPASWEAIFPQWVVILGVMSFVIGNATVAYLSLLTAMAAKRPRLLWAALTYPIYWLLMAIAAVKAMYQLVVKPSYWEKTVHGLSSDEEVSA